MTDSARNSTSSWLGSLAQPPPSSSPVGLHSKFSTIALGNGQGARRTRTGLGIFEDGSALEGSNRPSFAEEESKREDQSGWSVTLAESPKSRSRSKKPDPALTVYVSTSNSSLTLTRKLSEVLDFEARLQAHFPDRVAPRVTPPSIPVTSRRRSVLASLSRTLSPRRSSQSPNPSSLSRSSISNVELKELSSILTQSALDPSIRSHLSWRTFFVVRKDDLESARVERRIKKARSDQTMHIGPHLSDPPHDLSALLSHGVPLRGSLDRAARQEDSTMSGSTNELMNTPQLTDRSSYFSDYAEKIAMETDTPPSVKSIKHEQGISTSSSVDDKLPPVAENLEPSSIEQVMSSSPTPVEEPTKEGLEPAAAPPDPSRFLSPNSSLPSSPQAPKMARSLSSSSAMSIEKRSKGVTIDSFDIKRVLGKGCAGTVLLVKLKGTEEHYALKAITKRHVLAHRELDHTRTEQAVLKTCARDKSNPFVVRLHYSFHDQDTLYLALDFHPGGDLATQLARWGRLGRDRARFYMAELTEGVEGLHRAGIIYRDLKPENVLISADGHIILTDFGLSKDFGHSKVTPPTATLRDELPRPHWLSAHPTQRAASTPPGPSFMKRETAMTFCGTAEYLAPEVLLGEPYSYEVDAWSAGTMLYEMLVGITPFFAEDHSTMYKRVLGDDLEFQEDPEYPVFDDDTESFIRGMLQKNPLLRMTDARIKAHPYFNMIDWNHVYHRRYVPPFVPRLNYQDPTDTSQFDDMFLSMTPQVGPEEGEEGANDRDAPVGEPQAAFDDRGRDVFDGYSYYGRDSDSIKQFEMDHVPKPENEEQMEEDETLAEIDVDKLKRDENGSLDQEMASVPSIAPSEDPEQLGSQASSSDVSGINDSGFTDSDNTLSSLATVSTQPTTVAAESPIATRRRQSSSRSNLEPVSEVPPAPLSTEVVLEESEDVSDSDWDLLDGNDFGGFSRNGGREATLFSKGIRDKYRLVVAPLASPLRSPPSARNGSRVGSRKGSASSGRSSVPGNSLSTTPEPPRSPSGILRFASSRNKSKGPPRSISSQPSTLLEPLQTSASLSTLPSPSSPRPPSSTSSHKKMSSSFSATNFASTGSSIKNFAKSAFLPQKTATEK